MVRPAKPLAALLSENTSSFAGVSQHCSKLYSPNPDAESIRLRIFPLLRSPTNANTLTTRAPGRNHCVSTAFETIGKALQNWNSRILLFRSSSEMFVHRHWERFEKHSLSIIVTKRESTRQHEASSNLRAAQVSREVAKGMTKKFSAKHVKIAAFPYSRANLRAITSDRLGRFRLGQDDLTLWHAELPDEGWTQHEVRKRREKRGVRGGRWSRTQLLRNRKINV